MPPLPHPSRWIPPTALNRNRAANWTTQIFRQENGSSYGFPIGPAQPAGLQVFRQQLAATDSCCRYSDSNCCCQNIDSCCQLLSTPVSVLSICDPLLTNGMSGWTIGFFLSRSTNLLYMSTKNIAGISVLVGTRNCMYTRRSSVCSLRHLD